VSANPARGEVAFVVGDETYVLRPTMNALCAMQKRTGQTYGQLIGALTTLDLLALRDLLFTFLQPLHGKTIKTVEQAGDLMDAAGGHRPALDAITEVLRLNARKPTAGEPSADADPPTAQAGTGDNSGLTLVASA